MGFWDSGGDAPTPPNPMATAAAQTGTNVSTAIANSYLGNVNQTTPQGNLSFEKFADFTYTDPTSGQTFSIPRWNAIQTLTPTGQQAFETGQQSQLNMAQMGQQQSGMLRGLLGTAFDPNRGQFDPAAYLQQNPDVAEVAQASGMNPYEYAQLHYQRWGYNEGRMGGGQVASPMGSTAEMQGTPQASYYAGATPGFQYGYGSGGNIQDAYNLGGDLTRSYGPQDNFSADRSRIEAGLMERLNPQLQLENERVRQQLADQGIRTGQGAFTNAMDVYNRQANDARLAVIGQGGQEQQRLSQMAQAQAAFQNAAQAQANQQNAALAAFGNQAQAQRESQGAARGAFFNQASSSALAEAMARNQAFNQAAAQNLGRASTIFGSQNQLRNQMLQEMYQQRAQPMNEISALLSSGQVQQPNFINAARTQIPTTDVAGLINQNFAQQNDIFKTQQQSWNDLMGGILGFGGQVARAGIPMLPSDRRMKENIEPMGSVFGNGKKLPIYAYDYKDNDPDGGRHVGPMAQDVERLDPRAVEEIGGRKHIRLDRLGSIFGGAS